MVLLKIKYILGLSIFICLLCSCHSDRIDELLYVDNLLEAENKIMELSPSSMKKMSINNIAVCIDSEKTCIENEINFRTALDSLNIEEHLFLKINIGLNQAHVRTFYRHPRFSVFVKNGAFGNIFGFVLDHQPQKELPIKFDLNGRYTIYIGKQVSPNIYYFSN